MYQTIVKGKRLFQTSSQGYGDPITTFGVTDQGETPVSLVNIALASCVAMCIQGYYASQEGNKTMSVQVESQLENQHFRLNIGIGEEVALEKQKEILAYIEQKCKVKALLKEDLMIETRFFVLESVE
ncbi:OsmC family protein [Streptococcus ruminantium]|uniref:Peroxiredoxin n=1 Tax=Streptococcus ruminantium TaxID=1917441 RepID=A0A2Z5TXW4_9STRE|nr:OsmC family protein [Streptococcus ruminantium]BBA92211.1 peroxiredoxin [Streptococcus ruminantium]